MKLETIRSPRDLDGMSYEALDELAGEIRNELITIVSENGGHLASNLGAVELTLALHRVFHMPEDKIIFDVGHQSYVHKLITGRYDRFRTLRSYGGIAGSRNGAKVNTTVLKQDTQVRRFLLRSAWREQEITGKKNTKSLRLWATAH